MGSTQKLIETAIELQFAKIGYFFDSRHALIEECASLRERNAELAAGAGKREAERVTFARSLMQCLEELDDETKAKFAERGVGPDAIDRVFGPQRNAEERQEAPEADAPQPREPEEHKPLKLVQKGEERQTTQAQRPATDKQARLIAKLVRAGEIPPDDELYQAFAKRATFAGATALLDRYYGPRSQCKASCQ